MAAHAAEVTHCTRLTSGQHGWTGWDIYPKLARRLPIAREVERFSFLPVAVQIDGNEQAMPAA
jgi:hypothetical protein